MYLVNEEHITHMMSCQLRLINIPTRYLVYTRSTWYCCTYYPCVCVDAAAVV